MISARECAKSTVVRPESIVLKQQPPSCVRSLSLILGKRRLAIDIEGKIFRVLIGNKYKAYLLRICALIMVGIFAYIIRRFPYYNVTIIGNTVYSKVTAFSLSKCGVPFALCRENNRISYYETVDGREVPFEGPTCRSFLENISMGEKLSPMIPLSGEEIERVEKHTGLKNLGVIQEKILSIFNKQSGVNIANISDIIDEVKPINNPVMHVKKFVGGLYYIMTTDKIWLTRMIISDTVVPLQPGEIISTLYGKVAEKTSSSYDIRNVGDTRVVTRPHCETELVRRDSYIVGLDLTVKQKTENVHDDESIIYSLNRPRPFIHNSINMIHPFHLPATWDPFLTMMIVAQGLCQS